MTIAEMQSEILRLKKERNMAILAHSYQSQAITEVADFVGDSYALSLKAKEIDADEIMMCGVRFMAETMKLLSPQKHIWLANPTAKCPMAEQMDVDMLAMMKEKYPDYTVVAYINTTTALKTLCDICVTSSSAVRILKNIPDKNILFIPDINLGTYVSKQLPEKNFKFIHGGCPIHASVGIQNVIEMKQAHPNALLLVHPECKNEISEAADYVGSTSGIINFAKNSDAKEFIIGTENSITEHLQFDCPDKTFYPLAKRLICRNMKATTLSDVYRCVSNNGGEEIILPEETARKAKKCIDRMVELGG